ncbi:hypothetical protein JW898_04545 [Candidatus Woesearchaeota archaeon]|nr:hypothetical protein [Candidatus Woesearchaeota archaeon]
MIQEGKSVIDDAVSKIWIAPISNTHWEVAVKVAEQCLGVDDIDIRHRYFDPRKFSGGEFCPKFALGNGNPPTLAGKDVYILLFPGPYKSPEELVERACITACAAKDNHASKVILLATEFPHARQDRGPDEDEKAVGEPNTSRWHAAKFRSAGIDQVIVTHEHTPRISSFFALEYALAGPEMAANPDPNAAELQALGRKVFKSIPLHAILADYLIHHSWMACKEEGGKYLADGGANLALKAMDKGNRTFIDSLEAALFLPHVAKIYCDKARKAKNDPEKVEVPIVWVSDNFSTLDEKVEIYADDGLDTGGTMIKSVAWSKRGNVCARTGKAYGTPDDRLVYFTHPWFGGDGFLGIQERVVGNLPAREFITTETRPYINDAQYHTFKTKSTVIRLASLWADAIIANTLGHDVMTRYSGFKAEDEQHEFLSRLYRLKRHSRHFMVEDREPERRKIRFYLRE